MPRGPTLIINAIFPGSMMVLRGSVVIGGILLAAAGVALTAILISTIIPLPLLRHGGLAGYAVLAVTATALLWSALVRPVADPATMRRLHAAAAAAWLRGDAAKAQTAAHELTRHAPTEPGAWNLLGLVSVDPAIAADARRRADRLTDNRTATEG